MIEREKANMKRKKSIWMAVIGVMTAIVMLAGETMPGVYAASLYRAEEVQVGTTVVYAGDQLVFPTWGATDAKGMDIRLMDASGNVLKNDQTNGYSSYTVPSFSELGLNVTVSGSDGAVGWRIVTVPTQTPEQMRWDLMLISGESVSDGDVGRKSINSPKAYELQTGDVYILENGICRVEGDATIYAASIEFTVKTTGKYKFRYW